MIKKSNTFFWRKDLKSTPYQIKFDKATGRPIIMEPKDPEWEILLHHLDRILVK